jgi:hypothetical protein
MLKYKYIIDDISCQLCVKEAWIPCHDMNTKKKKRVYWNSKLVSGPKKQQKEKIKDKSVKLRNICPNITASRRNQRQGTMTWRGVGYLALRHRLETRLRLRSQKIWIFFFIFIRFGSFWCANVKNNF